MLTRIAIVSNPSAELDLIRMAMRNPLKFTVREFLSMDSCVHDLVSFPMEVLLMRVPFFDVKHVSMVLKARRRFHKASVVMMAREVNPMARISATVIQDFKLLQEPMEVQDLVSIIAKMRAGDDSINRMHPRVKRRDLVQIVDSHGQAHRASFIDFAQMGARIAISNTSLHSQGALKARESVQVHYSSSSGPGKIHRIAAKIIWSSGGLASGSSQTAGVRFIAAF
jgi:DNA-binding NtrC family response regulator